MVANNNQIGGKHYQANIQTWDYILAHDLGYLEGNIIKYVTRYRKKNGIMDLGKALHYLEKLIEVENDRLQHTQAASTEARQGFTPTTLATQVRGSAPDSRNDARRTEATNQCSQGSYQPTALRDII
jgi:hypothetical protein